VGEEKGPWYGRVIEVGVNWMTTQTFNNILLVSILFGGAYVAVALVPVHLTQIQKGYEKIDSSNKTMLERLDVNHREERERDRDFLYQLIQSKQLVAQ